MLGEILQALVEQRHPGLAIIVSSIVDEHIHLRFARKGYFWRYSNRGRDEQRQRINDDDIAVHRGVNGRSERDEGNMVCFLWDSDIQVVPGRQRAGSGPIEMREGAQQSKRSLLKLDIHRLIESEFTVAALTLIELIAFLLEGIRGMRRPAVRRMPIAGGA